MMRYLLQNRIIFVGRAINDVVRRQPRRWRGARGARGRAAAGARRAGPRDSRTRARFSTVAAGGAAGVLRHDGPGAGGPRRGHQGARARAPHAAAPHAGGAQLSRDLARSRRARSPPCAQLYLNAPGGQQYSVMAIIDMMNTISCDVSTVAFGNVAQSAALVLASGTKGKRFSMRNTRIMVNQPMGGCQGSFIDVKIQAGEQNRNLKLAQVILSNTTGQSMDACAELLDRESFLCALPACGRGWGAVLRGLLCAAGSADARLGATCVRSAAAGAGAEHHRRRAVSCVAAGARARAGARALHVRGAVQATRAR
jgi:hypothetical protein